MDYTTVFICYDFQPILEGVLTEALSAISGGWGFFGPDLITHDGYRALRVILADESEDTTILIWVFMPLAAAETMPVRYLLKTPGFQFHAQKRFGDGSTSLATWPELAAVFEEVVGQTQKAILEDWCNASVSEPSSWGITAMGDIVGSQTTLLEITTDAETFALASNISGYLEQIDEETFTFAYTPSMVTGIGNNTTTFMQSAVERIATGAQDLAMSRVEVSANNGDSMFSIVGGTRAQSET